MSQGLKIEKGYPAKSKLDSPVLKSPSLYFKESFDVILEFFALKYLSHMRKKNKGGVFL